jgi:hypothetical protein
MSIADIIREQIGSNLTVSISGFGEAIEDNYAEGEVGGVVNSWDLTKITYTTTIEDLENKLMDIIKNYVENHLYLTYKQKWLGVDEYVGISFSALVDNDNIEVNEDNIDFAEWKLGKKTLYSQHNKLVFEFNGIEIEDSVIADIISTICKKCAA